MDKRPYESNAKDVLQYPERLERMDDIACRAGVARDLQRGKRILGESWVMFSNLD